MLPLQSASTAGRGLEEGLAAIDQDAQSRHGARFRDLSRADRDALLTDMQGGKLDGEHWQGMPSKLFFDKRVVHDIAGAYYAHPTAWNEIGFGGPASPRGYVRLDADRRDPWEAAKETRRGNESPEGEPACRLTLSKRRAPATGARPTFSPKAAGSR